MFVCCYFDTFQVEELPFLLMKANEKERLKACVSDLENFTRMANNEDGIFELVKAWRFVGFPYLYSYLLIRIEATFIYS